MKSLESKLKFIHENLDTGNHPIFRSLVDKMLTKIDRPNVDKAIKYIKAMIVCKEKIDSGGKSITMNIKNLGLDIIQIDALLTHPQINPKGIWLEVDCKLGAKEINILANAIACKASLRELNLHWTKGSETLFLEKLVRFLYTIFLNSHETD